MSGNAFRDTSPISLDVLEKTWPKLKVDLMMVGFVEIEPIGTTWKKQTMGDVDLAATFPSGSLSLAVFNMQQVFGETNVKRFGNVVSVNYPVVDDRRVQVDVMVGNPKYLAWSRFGPSLDEHDPQFSHVKGVIRNLFLNTTLRMISTVTLSGGLDRSRLALDFDVGLHMLYQTKRGMHDNVLKCWKTHSNTFMTDDPSVIVKKIFGSGTPSDALTLEGCLRLAQEREARGNGIDLSKLAAEFVLELEDLRQTSPNTLGENLVDPVKFVKAFIDKIGQ